MYSLRLSNFAYKKDVIIINKQMYKLPSPLQKICLSEGVIYSIFVCILLDIFSNLF